ncbi:hypothetical protein EDD85DRAFT_961263 [Armillaria nabsnona]|nr:hypothetical protein EDD85DRAFT_961263 [Armillaria nabsnona]
MSSTTTPSLGMTFGSVYIGTTIAAILFGITNLQTIYRYSVAILWFRDVLHVAFNTHASYYYLVDLFGNYLALPHIVWSFKVSPFQFHLRETPNRTGVQLQILLSKAIIIGVQAYVSNSPSNHAHIYVNRCNTQRIRRSTLETRASFPSNPPVFLNVVVASCTAIFVAYDVYMIPDFSSTFSIRGAIYAVFSVTALSDFIIAFLMCYYLHKGRKVSPFSTTSAMLFGLMRLVVISGFATGISYGLILSFSSPSISSYQNVRLPYFECVADLTSPVGLHQLFACHVEFPKGAGSGVETGGVNINVPMPSALFVDGAKENISFHV